MSLLGEFKSFVMRGNVVDMAVGIIIGVAFGKVVSSLVNDIVMPPLGALIGGVNFNELSLVLKEAVDGAGGVTLNYGQFIQSLLDFLIIAAAVFVAVKVINELQRRMTAQAEAAPPPPSRQEQLLAEIRDLLSERR